MSTKTQITAPVINCPYCQGIKIIKRGQRQKQFETVQIYYCKHCQKRFTPLITKHKSFPLRIILDSFNYYNRFFTLQTTAEQLSAKYGIAVSPQNISNWLKSYRDYLPILRLRSFIKKNYTRKAILVESRLFHGQIYDFRYHRAKTDLILDEQAKNRKLLPLKTLLELVVVECPHTLFKSNQRASEQKDIFDLSGVKIVHKTNYANKTANFVLQAVANNKLRHETLQEFMFLNDTVTVAVELPILLDQADLDHYNHILGFKVPINLAETDNHVPIITGHIDIVQIRNGQIHILDYKPSARKSKPVDQLMIYALALARLTGLKLKNFTCAWFDKDDYYEFFPLHVVYKKKGKRKKIKESH